ncbi:FBD-associated F-box protein At4g10400-like [Lotus japonicus]|uniref:FBD-associated F-box protein At4g10400-like n=1 Tax=Lotus japonicus TaxID=34305 RepID=UPI00258272B8|nr:FBD-associated F-box protein At4g10400-like [Lotus japonicus]
MDIISMLPDELLCHILSFLPTKQAAATCVLSKRWKFLLTLVPALEYSDRFYLIHNKPYSCFERLVRTTILARDAKQLIRSFSLKYKSSDSDRSYRFFCNWVYPAIQRGIENLDIEIRKYSCRIDFTIFSCRTLVVLKLACLHVHFSSSVELPSLKCLHLFEVVLRKPQCLWELFGGCPILEDLKAISIKNEDGYFCVEGFKRLPKLVRADIGGYYRDYIPLKAISNVEFLSIYKFRADDDVVPQFPNLLHLVLTFEAWMTMNWHLVLEMLRNCPKLQVFELTSRAGGHKDVLPHTHLVPVPECLTSSLRKCSLGLAYGTENDLQFAKYIMQNSTTLRTMTICNGNFTWF